MAGGVNLQGFSEFKAKVSKLPKTLKKEAGLEVQDAGLLWAERAQKDAPVDHGRMRSEIRSVKTGETSVDIVSPVAHSPYIEWGTLTKVKVPSDLTAYAAQFRGSTGETDAKRAIYAWMNRVGIAPQFQYVVFISIITKGIRPQPFFFIQKPIVEKQFLANIKRIVETEH